MTAASSLWFLWWKTRACDTAVRSSPSPTPTARVISVSNAYSLGGRAGDALELQIMPWQAGELCCCCSWLKAVGGWCSVPGRSTAWAQVCAPSSTTLKSSGSAAAHFTCLVGRSDLSGDTHR
ncbi:hypothetical protein ZWY2020_050214 [Hordeum vulgare]|nr:hypothetical protein ZWY2020_050214 [Hordeum vulgare]